MKQRNTPDKFWTHVDIREPEYCWNWLMYSSDKSRPVFRLDGRLQLAHRLSYRFKNGDIPAGMQILHTCDNIKCVNPNHLFPGTQKDNMDDCRRKLRKPVGSRAYNAKLTESVILLARDEIAASGMPVAVYAKLHGLPIGSLRKAIKGETWRHLATAVETGSKRAGM